MKKSPFARSSRAMTATAASGVLALALSACAGSAGAGSGGGGDEAGEGFAFGASQAEIDEAIKDLDPVTLTFQPSAASPDSVMAPAGTVIQDYIEERSGGKITVEMVWGQAIAGYSEVHDALADGRLDIAYTLPVYDPTQVPAVNDLGTVMAALTPSPFQGELVASAVGLEMGWSNESVLETYDELGLTPLTPFASSGGYYSMCNSLVDSEDDWDGLQVRIASTAQAAQVKHLGGTPVSMEYGETFEALQRGTVDCTLGQLVPSAESGLFDVAPHLGYTTENSFSRSPGAYLAGSSFTDLPLAYQQIIFDANALGAAGGMEAVIGGNAAAVEQAKAAGGDVTPFDEPLQKAIADYSEELSATAIENGLIPDDVLDRIAAAQEKWTSRFEELGYTDEGTVSDFDEWYDEDTDFSEFASVLYEEGSARDHRPS